MTAADPPRQPSPDDNRRIMEAIDAVWSAGRSCYAGTVSDQSMAERLGVPRAWVTKIREGFFGPEDECEVRLDGVAGLDELIRRAQALEDRALQLATDAEALLLDAKTLRKAAGRR